MEEAWGDDKVRRDKKRETSGAFDCVGLLPLTFDGRGSENCSGRGSTGVEDDSNQQ